VLAWWELTAEKKGEQLASPSGATVRAFSHRAFRSTLTCNFASLDGDASVILDLIADARNAAGAKPPPRSSATFSALRKHSKLSTCYIVICTTTRCSRSPSQTGLSAYRRTQASVFWSGSLLTQ
jgi:hypothetical protein